MRRFGFPTGSAVCLLLFLSASTAQAQRMPNYNRRPALSPYVNLFNSNNQGGVNNYFSFVRPMQRQAQINQMQMANNQYLQQQIRHGSSARSVNQITLGSASQSGMLRSGTGAIGGGSVPASFFNYSHFYRGIGAAARRP